MTDRKLMQQALEALEWNLPVIEDYGDHEQLNRQHRAIIALRDRLAQPEQEPEQEFQQYPLQSDRMQIDPVTGDVSIGYAPPQRKQPEQEPIKESSVTHSHLWIGDLYGKEKNT